MIPPVRGTLGFPTLKENTERRLTSKDGVYRLTARTDHENALPTILDLDSCRERRPLCLGELLYHARGRQLPLSSERLPVLGETIKSVRTECISFVTFIFSTLASDIPYDTRRYMRSFYRLESADLDFEELPTSRHHNPRHGMDCRALRAHKTCRAEQMKSVP